MPDTSLDPASSAEKQTASAKEAGKKSAKVSAKFSVTVSLLLILAFCCFWLINSYATQALHRQHSEGLGNTLAQQTASQMTELLLANDLISMNVLLTSLTENSSITSVAVLNVSDELIAAARSPIGSPAPLIPLPFELNQLQEEYTAPIYLANSVAGSVTVVLDLGYLETAMVNSLLLNTAAALLLIAVSTLLISTYFQNLVTFPANLLAFALSKIRAGNIETCPEPTNSNELSTVIRQFNATAEFLAQNTFLNNFGNRQPEIEGEKLKFEPGTQDVTLLNIKMANFHYLASTLSESRRVNLLNKFYFYAGKVSQLYNGQVTYCSDGEVLVNFGVGKIEEEQAFYAICAGQLFLQLVGDIGDVDGQTTNAKFKLAVHGGQAVGGLYSPITQDTSNLTGRTLDLCRLICDECPDNKLLISQPCFENAGAASRVEGERFEVIDDDEEIVAYLSSEPMSDFQLLLERQAIQLVTVFSE
ncbi:MAG: hypothetical protein AB8B95_10725 [Pseudohongiellaceae bacterium]